MRDKNNERDHRRGNLPNDDSFPTPITFLKLSPSLKEQVLRERSLALSRILPQIQPVEAWRLYSKAPGLLCFWTVEVARRVRAVARMTGRSYQSIIEVCCKISPVLLLIKPEEVEEKCFKLARSLDPGMSLISLDSILGQVARGPHLITSKPEQVKSLLSSLKREVNGTSLLDSLHILGSEPSSVSLTPKTLAVRLSGLRHHLISFNAEGPSEAQGPSEALFSHLISTHPILLSLKWEAQGDESVGRFTLGIRLISDLLDTSLFKAMSSTSTALINHIRSSKGDLETSLKSSIDLWATITGLDTTSILANPNLLLQDHRFTDVRLKALFQAHIRCMGSSASPLSASQVAAMVSTCPRILLTPYRSRDEALYLSSRLRHLARLLSLDKSPISPAAAAREAWEMAAKCPSLLLHDAPDLQRMAIEAGLAVRGLSNLMVSKREKETALSRGIEMARICPLLLSVRPGTAHRGRRELTRAQEPSISSGTHSRSLVSYESGATRKQHGPTRGILAGLSSDLVTDLLSARPDLLVVKSSRQSLSSLISAFREYIGADKDMEAIIKLILDHSWLIGGESHNDYSSVEIVDRCFGGVLGKIKSLDLILNLIRPNSSSLSTSSPYIKDSLLILVSTIRTQEAWSSELDRYLSLYDQKSLLKLLSLVTSNPSSSNERLSQLISVNLSSKVSFLSALSMSQIDFERLTNPVAQPKDVATDSNLPKTKRGYMTKT